MSDLGLPEIEKEIENNKYFKKVENDLFIKYYYRANLPSIFDSPLKRELRGITFSKKEKDLVARPYHKFFNINEHEETKEDNLNNKNFIAREKLDGSLIYFCFYKNKLHAFTQRRFENEYTQKAWEIINKNKKLLKFIENLTQKGYTPLFELISPDFQIVIPYKEDKLILTEIRENKTGKYVLENFENEIKENNILLPKKYFFNLKEAKDFLENKDNIEGLVLKDINSYKNTYPNFPLFVKLKSPWYLEKHYATSYLSNIPVHKLFLNYIQNKLDDIFSNVLNSSLKEKKLKELKPYVEFFEFLLENLEKISKNIEKFENWKEKKSFIDKALEDLLKKIEKKYKITFPKEILLETVYAIINKSNYEENLGLKIYSLMKKGKLKL